MTQNKKKQVNANPGESPFRKGQGSDESYGITEDRENLDAAFTQFQDMMGDESLTGNLWEGAENKMNIGDNFGGVKTDFDNQYAGLENRFAGMENTMEDLTVNQKQAEFQREMSQQGAADTMQTFRGAAGSSGVAGLAQAMANQQSGAARQISTDIGQQESANQRLAAQTGMSIQQMEAQGASAVDMAKAGGAQTADQMGSQAELAQAGGMQAADIATGQGAMEAQKIQLQGKADSRDLQWQLKQGELSFLSGLLQAGEANKDADYRKSDRRLKKNITKIGESTTGINIYSFEYKNPTHGDGLFQGVMSDEVPQEAIMKSSGYDMVNYNMLDVEFKQL